MARMFAAGNQQYLENVNANVTGEPFTISAWFKLDNLAATRSMVSCRVNASNYGHILRYEYSQNKLQACTVSSTTSYAVSSITMTAGVWHHGLAVFASATDRRIYLDGGSKGTNAGNPAGLTLGVVSIGKRSSIEYMSGNIAHVALWDVALTDTQAAALAKGVSPLLIQPAALAAYWPLAGVGAVELDAVGKNNMLVVGATAAGDPPMIRSIVHRRYFVLAGISRFFSMPIIARAEDFVE